MVRKVEPVQVILEKFSQ